VATVDTYYKLKTQDKDELFIDLFELKRQKTNLEKRIKELESQYKSDLEGLEHDLYYELSNGIKFSIKRSQRAGNVDTKRLGAELNINVDDYRKKPTIVFTLREDK
jgi:predicted phage-related endonuclease